MRLGGCALTPARSPSRRPGSKKKGAARCSLAALVAVVAFPAVAPAMEFRTSHDPSGHLVVHADGPIARGDERRFREALAGAGNRTPRLAINSPGGLVGEAIGIATIVNQARIPVTAGDLCASACFFVFAASPYPMVESSTRLGVHRAYQKDVGETTRSMDATMELARIAQRLSVPSAVVGRVMSTPGDPRSMYWLTEEDLRAMRVRFALPAAASRPATLAAAPPVDAAAAAMAETGREDRVAYRRWIAGLAARAREGAAHASGPRRPTGFFHCLSASWEFSAACYAGRRFWAKVGGRIDDPSYRAGWEGP